MSDDDYQTARGGEFDSVTFVASDLPDLGSPARADELAGLGGTFSDPTARSIDALNAAVTGERASSASPIRLSIPGELHFEILGTPTVGQLEQYARLIESLIVIAQLAAEQRTGKAGCGMCDGFALPNGPTRIHPRCAEHNEPKT